MIQNKSWRFYWVVIIIYKCFDWVILNRAWLIELGLAYFSNHISWSDKEWYLPSYLSNHFYICISDTIIQGLKINESHHSAVMEANQRLSSSGINVDEEGLIVPKKLYNPCLDSRSVRDLNHEIRWNAKT